MTDKDTNSSEINETKIPTSPARRKFLGQVGGATAASVAGAVGVPAALLASGTAEAAVTSDTPRDLRTRRAQAFAVRAAAALFQASKPTFPHPDNGDEDRYPDRRGSYSKGLQHNNFGEVLPASYSSLKRALESGKPRDFERIQLGGTRKLVSPQAGLAFDMEGADAHLHVIRPAPTFRSAEQAGEIVENYWMALLRDVPFNDYASSPLAAAAVADLNSMSDFRGPKVNGLVTPQTLFRENFVGGLDGPLLSQFFIKGDADGNIPYGTNGITQRVQTVAPGVDYMTNQAEWLAVQNGVGPAAAGRGPRRYMTDGRDVGEWVHVDVLYQAYFMACLVLDFLKAPLNPTNPYVNSQTQEGFATFGGPFIKTLLVEASTRALKAVWYQKWFVHLRIRPEAMGGAIHLNRSGQRNYDIHSDALNSNAVARTFSKNGTYLLPMAFPEGSPIHPAYGAGHATVAGACITVIKALYDGSALIPNPQMVDSNTDELVSYTGGPLTVEGELNKIGINVANGRNMAGVHWRTDGRESMLLGEQVAIGLLQDTQRTFNENRDNFFNGFKFKGFLGNQINL